MYISDYMEQVKKQLKEHNATLNFEPLLCPSSQIDLLNKIDPNSVPESKKELSKPDKFENLEIIV